MNGMNRYGRAGRGGVLAAVVLGVTFAAGCEVTNPGPVDDEFLTLPASQAGFVNGAKERINRAIAFSAYTTGLSAREIFPGGQTGSYGHDVNVQAGNYTWGYSGAYTLYNNSQQARWIGEEAIRRFTEVGDVAPALMAEAHLWAGFGNRVLGENYCVGAIDGGPGFWAITEDGQVDREGWNTYFQRAEQHFTTAIQINANDQLTRAARMGRAQVRVWMEDWAGAVADAQQIADQDVALIEMSFAQGGNVNQRNQLYFASSSDPYRSYSVKFTFYEDYYTETGDPRTPWTTYAIPTDNLCVGSLQGLGRVPCLRQAKYTSEEDPMRLASGQEMRLIEAEALLVQGNWQAAMDKINAVRTSNISETTGQPLQPWTAGSLQEAWTVLMRERGIELWLEGRRMGDIRRWQPMFAADGVTPWPGGPQAPGDLETPDFEAQSTVFSLFPRGRPLMSGTEEPRALCFNVSAAERNNNPHFAQDDEGG